jgi:hypothetical protein
MSWLSLLTNKWFAGGLAALFLASGCWISGNVHGHKAQSAADTAALVAARTQANAAMQANAEDLATISKLRAANARWAQQAEASDAKANHAAKLLAEQRQASSAALAAAQKKLEETIHATPEARAWGDERLPGAVVQRLRDDAADRSH